MKKQNLMILIIALVLIAAVAVLAAVIPQKSAIPDDAGFLSVTQAPATEAPNPTASPEPSASEAPAAEPQPAAAYLVVTVRGMVYEPLPLEGEGSFTLSQDENTSNTIHVTPDSIWMEHSTCDNQDCVDQGIVSLDNMKNRVLSNMIICLPNEVVLELHTPESLESVFGLQM